MWGWKDRPIKTLWFMQVKILILSLLINSLEILITMLFKRAKLSIF